MRGDEAVMMIDRMLFTIPAEKHTEEEIESLLRQHPEVKFVSLVGLDLGVVIRMKKYR